jgi:hypothetical protein
VILQLLFCFFCIVLGEVLCIESDYLTNFIGNLFPVGKSLTVYHDRKLFIENIVFQLKECFHEFLLDSIKKKVIKVRQKNLLLKSNVVDFGVSVEPFEVSIKVCEGASPVCGILKLILDLRETLSVNLDEGLSLGDRVHKPNGRPWDMRVFLEQLRTSCLKLLLLLDFLLT